MRSINFLLTYLLTLLILLSLPYVSYNIRMTEYAVYKREFNN